MMHREKIYTYFSLDSEIWKTDHYLLYDDFENKRDKACEILRTRLDKQCTVLCKTTGP